MKSGHFVISLDFELYWGVRDSRSLHSYEMNILGARKAIPEMLQLFEDHSIQATFATVGFLFAKNKEELNQFLPQKKPSYANSKLSPYVGYLDTIGPNEKEDPFHFGNSLIKEIFDHGNEIATHTFCHYYCLEEGQSMQEFASDIEASIHIAKAHKYNVTSFVFPRNQYNEVYLKVCSDAGILSFRGNEQSWIYDARSKGNESQLRRAFRLLDSYLNISGHHCSTDAYMQSSQPINIPSSRFLRPYNKRLKFLESFRLQRIKRSMTFAAKKNLTYHLWWHPHNFGVNRQENLLFLKKILTHYMMLNKSFNFQNITMENLAKKLLTNEK